MHHVIHAIVAQVFEKSIEALSKFFFLKKIVGVRPTAHFLDGLVIVGIAAEGNGRLFLLLLNFLFTPSKNFVQHVGLRLLQEGKLLKCAESQK
jgi:hypothetical protein